MYPCGKGIDIYKCLYYQKMQYCCTRIGIGYSLMASWPNLCLTGISLEAIEVIYTMENIPLSTVLVILLLLPLSNYWCIFVSGSISVFAVRFASYMYPQKYHRNLRWCTATHDSLYQ